MGVAMTDDFNRKAYELAEEQADKRYPLPDDLPGGAAFKAGVHSALVLMAFVFLDQYMSEIIAGLVAIGLAALVVYVDNRSARRRNAQEQVELYRFYKDDPRLRD